MRRRVAPTRERLGQRVIARGDVFHRDLGVIAAAPQALRLIGWAKESVAPGDVVSITLYPAKNGNRAGRLNKMVLADGTVLRDTALGADPGSKAP